MDAFVASEPQTKSLFIACASGRVSVCRELLRAHRFAEVDAVDANSGLTLLCTACDKGDYEMVSMLLECKASVTVTCKGSGNTALHFSALRGHLDVCKLLLAYDAAVVNSESLNGFTPLHVASVQGHLEICRLFVNAGADHQKRSKEGWVARDCATDPSVESFLRQQEAEVSAPLRGFASAPIIGAMVVQQKKPRIHRSRKFSGPFLEKLKHKKASKAEVESTLGHSNIMVVTSLSPGATFDVHANSCSALEHGERKLEKKRPQALQRRISLTNWDFEDETEQPRSPDVFGTVSVAFEGFSLDVEVDSSWNAKRLLFVFLGFLQCKGICVAGGLEWCSLLDCHSCQEMSDDSPVLANHSGRIFRLIEKKGERVSSLGELASVPKLKEHVTLEKRPWTRLRIVVVGDDRDFVGIISRVLASTNPCSVIPFVYQRFEWTCDLLEHSLNVTQLETMNEEWLLRLVVCECAVIVCVFNGASSNADNSVERFSSLISLNCPKGIAAIGLVVGRPLIQHKRFISWISTPSLPEGPLEKQKLRDLLLSCVLEAVRKKRYLSEAPVAFALLHQALQGHLLVARGVVDRIGVAFRISSEEALEFLHKTGDIVFFSNDRYLSSVVVTSLDWIAGHVSAMIRFSSSIKGFVGVDEMSLLCGAGENVLGPFVVEILLRAMVCLGVVWSKVVPSSSVTLVKVLVPITLLPTTDAHIETGLCHSRCFMLDRFSASNFAGFEAMCAFQCNSEQSSWNLHAFSLGRDGGCVFVNFWPVQTGEAMVMVRATSSSNKDLGLFFDVLTMLESYLNNKNLEPMRWVFCPSCIVERGLIISKTCWGLVGAFALSKLTHGYTHCTRCRAHLSWKDLVPELFLFDLPQLSCAMTDVILGQGGNASVILATSNSEKVAVKKLHLFGRESRDDLAMSLIAQRKEISLMWRVRGCDRIAGVLGVNSSVFPPLIVMEFCKEGELTGYLYDENGVSRNVLSPKLKIQIALDVLVALSFLHREELCMIHRDVRSPNVLLCERAGARRGEPAAKLCDFGLATWCVQGISYPLPTFQWLSPEVLLGAVYDQSADMYSFGMLLYEIMAERIPYSEFDYLTTVVGESKTQVWKEVVARDSICSGLRPMVSNLPFGQLMKDCWLKPLQRPSATVLLQNLSMMTDNDVPVTSKIAFRGRTVSENVASIPCGHRAFLSDPEILHAGDPTGKVVTSCCLDERGCLWMSTTDGRMIVTDVKNREQKCFKGEKTCFALTSIPSRNMVVGAMFSGELFCWEHLKGKMKVFQAAWLDVPRGKCKQIASGPKGIHLWTGDEEGNVLCWKWEQSSIRRKGKYSLIVGKLCFGRNVNSVAVLHDSRNCTILLVGIGSPLNSQVFAVHSSMFETPPHTWDVGVDLLPGKNPGLIFVRDMHLWSLNEASGVAMRCVIGFDESKKQLSVEQLYSIRLKDPSHLAFSPQNSDKVVVLEKDGQLIFVKNCGTGTHVATWSADVKLKMAFHHEADSFVGVGESGNVLVFLCK